MDWLSLLLALVTIALPAMMGGIFVYLRSRTK